MNNPNQNNPQKPGQSKGLPSENQYGSKAGGKDREGQQGSTQHGRNETGKQPAADRAKH